MLRAAVILGLLTAALGAPAASAAVGDVEQVSVGSNGAQGDGDSTAPSISHSGRVVAFQSAASTLVGGDGNGGLDVFVRRRASASTERVSLGLGGAQANGRLGGPGDLRQRQHRGVQL